MGPRGAAELRGYSASLWFRVIFLVKTLRHAGGRPCQMSKFGHCGCDAERVTTEVALSSCLCE
jgi:hypothetical protein